MPRLREKPGHVQATFVAMGSPCELLVDSAKRQEAARIARIVAAEAWRIEDKFSRYRAGNIVDRINNSHSRPVDADEETAGLLDFAATLHAMSNGRFDITSGVLREAWTFDGSDNVPSKAALDRLLARIGWHQVTWQKPTLKLERGMQIDFGGIAKEFAVDRAAGLAAAETSQACLINFGGDLVATGPPATTSGWQVGIDPLRDSSHSATKRIRLATGGLATSGDARRFLMKDGIRYSHILDPTTGWPVVDAPRSITVAADTCTLAGMLATLAMLQGPDAEQFLRDEGVRYWAFR